MTTTKSTYIARGNQSTNTLKTQTFNIDNGAGTTIDDELCNLPYAIDLVDVRAVYTEATDTAGAANANFSVGITAGGATYVAATALAAAKAIGATTSGTILIQRVAANTTLFVRHTGIASTEVGQYYVQVVYRPVA